MFFACEFEIEGEVIFGKCFFGPKKKPFERTLVNGWYHDKGLIKIDYRADKKTDGGFGTMILRLHSGGRDRMDGMAVLFGTQTVEGHVCV